jgi:hypothetical protein
LHARGEMVRFKNRYFLFELAWDDGRVDEALGTGDVFKALRDAVQVLCT